MSYKPTQIELSEGERTMLESWSSGQATEQRLVLRSRIILAAASGQGTNAIAEQLDIRPATVSKWRLRFAEHLFARVAIPSIFVRSAPSCAGRTGSWS